MKPKQQKKKRVQSVRRRTRRQMAWVELIHERIYSGTYPTVRELAAELRCSPRSVKRDIKSLKHDWKMPIEVSRKGGRIGYYYSRPVARKLACTINEQEFFEMALSHRISSQFPVKKLQRRLGVNFEKVLQLAKSDSVSVLEHLQNDFEFRPFAPEAIDVETLLTIARCIRERRALRFEYKKHLAAAPEMKCINPYRYICAANSWYVIGYDREKDVDRTYLLSRFTMAEATDIHFKKVDFDLDEYLKGCFIVMKGSESHDVVIEFNAWAAPYIRNRTFTKDQKIEELPNGHLRISFWLNCLEEVDQWVASFRKNAYVVQPQPLRERLRTTGDFYQDCYGPGATAPWK